MELCRKKLHGPLPTHFPAELRNGIIQKMEPKRLSYFYLHKYQTHVGSVALQQSQSFLRANFSSNKPHPALFRTTHRTLLRTSKNQPVCLSSWYPAVLQSPAQGNASRRQDKQMTEVIKEMNRRPCFTQCLGTSLTMLLDDH